jgi:hypothetical protein
MSKDDEDLDGDRHPEDWTPEKEARQDPDAMLERYMKVAERLLTSLEKPAQGPLDYYATAASRAQSQIGIRRIRNGHLMTYFEAVPAQTHPTLGVIFRPQEVEIYLADYKDGEKYIGEALRHSDLLAKTAEAVRKLQEEAAAQVRSQFGATFDELRAETRRPPTSRVQHLDGPPATAELQDPAAPPIDPPPVGP